MSGELTTDWLTVDIRVGDALLCLDIEVKLDIGYNDPGDWWVDGIVVPVVRPGNSKPFDRALTTDHPLFAALLDAIEDDDQCVGHIVDAIRTDMGGVSWHGPNTIAEARIIGTGEYR